MTVLRRMGAIAAVFALTATSAGVANAGGAPPASATGTLTYTASTLRSVQQVGDSVVIHLTSTVAYTGSFQGTSTLSGTLLLHPDGTANFHDTELFTGTVNGVPGTVTFDLNGIGSPDPTLPVTDVAATDTIVGATGRLAGLHGVLHETAVVDDPMIGPFGTYAGPLEGPTG